MSAIAYIDLLDGDHSRQSFPIATGATLRIGRGLDCEICIDDPHLAPEHALLEVGPEPVAQLTLLPSLNGALQGRRRHAAGERLDWPADGLLQLGHTRLRLRHAAAPLAPERALLHAPRGLGLLLLGLVVLLLVAGETWLGLEPGANWLAYAGPLLAIGVGVLAWAGFWSLLTQLFQRRFTFLAHLRRVLVYLLATLGVGLLLPALAFMASAPWLLVPVKLLPVLLGTGLVYWHASAVWPGARLLQRSAVVGGMLMWLAMGWTRQENLQHRWREPYLSTLLPPPLRAAPLRPVDDLLQDATALQAPLADKARRDTEGNEVAED